MTGDGDDRRSATRTCVATRQTRPADELIRFVRAPDGTVVPDLKRRLPGRGVWVTAEAEAVRTAIKRKAFGRGFRSEVRVGPELVEQVDALLERGALEMLGMVNKAGHVVTGFAKVESAIMAGTAAGIIHAVEAAADGIRKVRAALRRSGRDLPEVICFPGARLDLALGRSNVVHAALLAGPVSDAFLARVDLLVRYRGTASQGSDGANDETGQPAGTDRE